MLSKQPLKSTSNALPLKFIFANCLPKSPSTGCFSQSEFPEMLTKEIMNKLANQDKKRNRTVERDTRDVLSSIHSHLFD